MRTKRHEPYYKITGYQILAKKTDEEMCAILGICKRTYRDKIEGYSDFTSEQGKTIALVLGVTQDDIF